MFLRLQRGPVRRFRSALNCALDRSVESYSQEGEDIILRRLFANQAEGFYVDIGAHHPVRFSNTYYLYLRGWRGLNVDATPGSMAAFERIRPRDINVEIAVGAKTGTHALALFNDPALNTVSPSLAEERGALPGYHVVCRKSVRMTTLSQLLDDHLPARQAIDLLSVDVEGSDEDVIASNDWDRYRPRVVLVETRDTGVAELPQRPITTLLSGHGYVAWAKLYSTAIFLSNDFELP